MFVVKIIGVDPAVVRKPLELISRAVKYGMDDLDIDYERVIVSYVHDEPVVPEEKEGN